MSAPSSPSVSTRPALPPLPTSLPALAQVSAPQWEAVLAAEPAAGLAWMRAAAQLGGAQAQLVYGQWLLDGHGAPRNAEEALQWFLKAARQKHTMGMNMAGRCYDNGWGVKPDPEQAAYWFQQAAEAGLDAGMYNYANLLATGSGVPKNEAKALGWYSQAAGLGHAKSMTKAGRFFELGIVVPRDLGVALRCYRDGALGGDFRGQFCYAGMLAGQGKWDEALEWLRKVPLTATPAYLREAGRLLQDSPMEAARALGREMLALGEQGRRAAT